MPIPVTARSKASDCGFETNRGHGCLSLVRVVCQVGASASGLSLVQRIPTEFDVNVTVNHDKFLKIKPTR